jgi:ribosomal-protein-alanine N-acetyltransferase
MRLEGSRCVVRPWTARDADAIVLHANNFNVARQLRDRFPHPYTRRHALEFLQHATGSAPPSNFAIVVAGEPVGGLAFVAGTDIERYSAEVGYWLSESLWGRGIATEALVLLTDYVLIEVNMLRLFALPFADNHASRRVLEKAGYVCEGILRSSSVKAGEPRDQAMYARINEAWRRPENRASS